MRTRERSRGGAAGRAEALEEAHRRPRGGARCVSGAAHLEVGHALLEASCLVELRDRGDGARRERRPDDRRERGVVRQRRGKGSDSEHLRVENKADEGGPRVRSG